METHSSILAWEILWTEEPGGLQQGLMGCKELDVTEQLSTQLTTWLWLISTLQSYLVKCGQDCNDSMKWHI